MKLRILREAEEEAHASAIWYDDQLVGLGDGFLDELVAALQQIEDDPDRFPKLETAKSKQIRRCRLVWSKNSAEPKSREFLTVFA